MNSSRDNKTQGLRNIKPNVFGQSLRDPILGRHFKLPGQSGIEQPVKLDTSLSYIPVYAHLKVHDAELLKRPSTPPAIRRIEKEEYMDFYTSPSAQISTTKKTLEGSSAEIATARKEEKRISKTPTK